MKQSSVIAWAAALMLSTASLSSWAGSTPANPLGEAAPSSAASRTIVVTNDTSWLEVKVGEIVNFVIGDKSFSWNFDGDITMSEIDLNKIAPSGALNRLVKVYIDRTPPYDGA